MSTEEVEVRDVIRILWRGKWLVMAITLLSAFASVWYALQAVSWYQADVVMVPVESRSVPGALGQLGGLASLAGVNIQPSATQTPLAILRSREFGRSFIEDKQLLPVFNAFEKGRHRLFGGASRNDLDIRGAMRLFDEKVRAVTEDKKAGLVTISITWVDPAMAAEWANMLAARLNDSLRTRALQETRENIKYLRGEMAATSVLSLQQSIGRVLESEIQKLIMAQAGKDYAFRIVDPAVQPSERVSPRRAVIVVMGTLGGLLLATVILLALSALRKP